MRFTALLAAAGVIFTLAVAVAPSAPGHAQASGTAARGKLLYVRCASCHAVKPSAAAKIGPHLAGIAGKKGGTVAGYRYSKAMKAKAPVWTDANLDRWLAKPANVVPGTSMAFVGMPNPADRKALIAYLKTLR